jgi:hypothetical protein
MNEKTQNKFQKLKFSIPGHAWDSSVEAEKLCQSYVIP